ncbi:MAG: HDOD domain-containing protein [Hahellaceae bacterium]|nr:HDOD domain-containing protein [Hahellaceae bacterium]MCP5169753.1 HDOD domain-containing protein [Hahellaceae bacterium]
MDENQLQQALKGFVIPPRPQIVVDIQFELASPTPSINAIAQLISQDAGLSGSVLKIVNSPFFGLASKVKSVSHAVNLLGISLVVNLVTAIALKSALSDESVMQLNRFWDSESDVANVATVVSKYLKLRTPDEAYALGLFHNCGVPLMMMRFADYPELMAKAYQAKDRRVIDVENLHYKTDHAVIGYYTARSWNISDVICEAILVHHCAEKAFDEQKNINTAKRDLLTILKISEHLCGLHQILGECPVDYEWERIGEKVMAEANLEEDDLLNIRENCRDLGLLP